MEVKPITDGAISGSDTITLGGNLFGGVDLNADGTNAATVIVRDENSTGTVLVHSVSVQGKTIIKPFRAPSGKIYYSISGTGASAMLYEWVE